MKVVILAGGLGSRLAEETQLRPKPMVEIGGRPLLWHIMKIYGHHGFCDFVVCAGYMSFFIKEYFANYLLHNSDISVDLENGTVRMFRKQAEAWKVAVIDTGDGTMTGGRVGRIRDMLGDGPFFLTYGDGVGDIDIGALLAHHRRCGLAATVTGVRPPGRFGALRLENDRVAGFQEKPAGDGGRINGGFLVLEPEVIDLVSGDSSVLETDVLPRLAETGRLSCYRHDGFWYAVDTLREKNQLAGLWETGAAPWKVWAN